MVQCRKCLQQDLTLQKEGGEWEERRIKLLVLLSAPKQKQEIRQVLETHAEAVLPVRCTCKSWRLTDMVNRIEYKGYLLGTWTLFDSTSIDHALAALGGLLGAAMVRSVVSSPVENESVTSRLMWENRRLSRQRYGGERDITSSDKLPGCQAASSVSVVGVLFLFLVKILCQSGIH